MYSNLQATVIVGMGGTDGDYLFCKSQAKRNSVKLRRRGCSAEQSASSKRYSLELAWYLWLNQVETKNCAINERSIQIVQKVRSKVEDTSKQNKYKKKAKQNKVGRVPK